MIRLNDMLLKTDLIYSFEDYDQMYGKKYTGSPDVPVWGSSKIVQRAGPTCLSPPNDAPGAPNSCPHYNPKLPDMNPKLAT